MQTARAVATGLVARVTGLMIRLVPCDRLAHEHVELNKELVERATFDGEAVRGYQLPARAWKLVDAGSMMGGRAQAAKIL